MPASPSDMNQTINRQIMLDMVGKRIQRGRQDLLSLIGKSNPYRMCFNSLSLIRKWESCMLHFPCMVESAI